MKLSDLFKRKKNKNTNTNITNNNENNTNTNIIIDNPPKKSDYEIILQQLEEYYPNFISNKDVPEEYRLIFEKVQAKTNIYSSTDFEHATEENQRYFKNAIVGLESKISIYKLDKKSSENQKHLDKLRSEISQAIHTPTSYEADNSKQLIEEHNMRIAEEKRQKMLHEQAMRELYDEYGGDIQAYIAAQTKNSSRK